MHYVVHPNKYSSKPNIISIIIGNKFKWFFELHSSSWYDPRTIDNQGYNKGPGIGYFPHHLLFSTRIGWIPSIEENKFDIGIYRRRWSKWSFEYVCQIESDTRYYFIKHYNGYHLYDVESNFYKVNNNKNKIINLINIFNRFGYGLQLYHGGRSPAPQTIIMDMGLDYSRFSVNLKL